MNNYNEQQTENQQNSQPYPNGQRQPYGYPPPVYNPHYSQYNSPYPPQYNQVPPPYYAQKKPVNKGLIVFSVIACLVAVVCVFGFALCVIFTFVNNSNSSLSSSNSPAYDYYYGYDYDYGYSYGDDDDEDDSSQPEEEVEEPAVEEQQSYTIPDIDVQSYTDGITINSQPDTEELSPNEVYEKVVVSTVTITAYVLQTDGSYEEGSGSGIIITSDGFILTNSHVVNDSTSTYAVITTSDGQDYEAVVVGYDKATDLAVLKADATGFTPAEFGSSDEMEMGDWVMAVGSPGGADYTGSVTRGVISGLDRTVGYSTDDTMTYIQTDAAINPGNSGGPLVNMYGQVIGINTSKIVADYYEGMGFAIPISDAEDIINAILENGVASDRVRLGITATVIDDSTAYMYGVPTGVLIYTIDEDSSFIGTEVQVGDIITHFQGEEITDLTQLSQLFLSYSPGDVVEVTLYRVEESGDSYSYTTEITLLADNGETQG
ncbi:MAG: trypsin-like peptidase domain-containing protein [Clostridia bacterium]